MIYPHPDRLSGLIAVRYFVDWVIVAFDFRNGFGENLKIILIRFLFVSLLANRVN